MTRRTRSFFYLTALFLAGVLTGGLLGLSLAKKQMTRPLQLDRLAPRIEQEITTKLDLDAAQQQKLRPLIDRSLERIGGIYFQTLREIDGVLHDAQIELEADLRPEQKAKMGTLAPSRQDFIKKHNPLSPPLQP